MGKFVSITLVVDQTAYARVAQLVERDLAKVEAAGSSPVSRSGNEKEVVPFRDGFFLIIRVHFALEGSRSPQKILSCVRMGEAFFNEEGFIR